MINEARRAYSNFQGILLEFVFLSFPLLKLTIDWRNTDLLLDSGIDGDLFDSWIDGDVFDSGIDGDELGESGEIFGALFVSFSLDLSQPENETLV